MYAYIIGEITEIKPTYITLEKNHIGYLVLVANPYVYELNQELKMYIYHHVREDINSLYGFSNMEQKDLFLKLISVSGIGPKTALSILASNQITELINAIGLGDAKYLIKFPGIGMKTAQQIILDLKGKLVSDEEITMENKELLDLKEALQALGYSKIQVNRVIKKVDPKRSLNEMLKDALKMLV